MSWWSNRRERRAREPVDPIPLSAVSHPSVAEECGAFLTGRYPDYLGSRTDRIPMWARLNPLCHQGEEGVVALARGRISGDQTWAAATAYLAEEVLCAAARYGTTVEDIQRSVLVPLELSLATKSQRVAARPAVLVRAVVQALREHPSLRHPIS